MALIFIEGIKQFKAPKTFLSHRRIEQNATNLYDKL